MDHNLRNKYFAELEKELQELIDPETGWLNLRYAELIPCPLCGAATGSHEKLFINNGYTFVR